MKKPHYSQSEQFKRMVREREAAGMTRSDAQAEVELQFMKWAADDRDVPRDYNDAEDVQTMRDFG